MASPPACPSRCSIHFHPQRARPGKRRDPPPRLRGRVRLLPAHATPHHARDQARGGPLFRRANQWHLRLRRSSGAGTHCAERMPALKVLGKPAFTLARHEAYIGVLIDDLVTRGDSRALPDVHQPRRIPACSSAKIMPIPVLPAARSRPVWPVRCVASDSKKKPCDRGIERPRRHDPPRGHGR